jgi:hypothetical protein
MAGRMLLPGVKIPLLNVATLNFGQEELIVPQP